MYIQYTYYIYKNTGHKPRIVKNKINSLMVSIGNHGNNYKQAQRKYIKVSYIKYTSNAPYEN